jgi:hypothetical protein
MAKRFVPSISLGLMAAPAARAGMTAYDLNDVVRLRLEDISFFAVLLLVCALGIKLLWNHLAKGLPRLPRITFVRSLCLTALLSLLMLLVLSMISGARELLTPGAWRRQGSASRHARICSGGTWKPNAAALVPRWPWAGLRPGLWPWAHATT